MATIERHPISLPPVPPSLRPPVPPIRTHSALPQTPERRSSARASRLRPPHASPEIISSLISSLSSISTPVETLFDSFPVVSRTGSVPPSPARLEANGQSFGMDYGAFKLQDFTLGAPDNAAIPPVVRTSKPPSGFSPLTAPKKPSGSSTPKKSPGSPNPGNASGWPLPNVQSPWVHDQPDQIQSIGNLSIHSGPNYTASVRSNGSANTSKNTSQASGLKASKEKMREMDRERKRKAAGRGLEDSPKRARSPLLVKRAHSSAAIRQDPPESPLPGQPALDLGRPAAQHVPPRATSINAVMSGKAPENRAGSPGGIGSGKAIPARESSLRQSGRIRRKSVRAMKEVNTKIDEVPEGFVGQREADERGSEAPRADEVSRRIRQLKAQKEERDRARSDAEKAKSPTHNSLPAPSLPKAETTIRSSSTSRVAEKDDGEQEPVRKHSMELRPPPDTKSSGRTGRSTKPVERKDSVKKAGSRSNSRARSPMKVQKSRPTSPVRDKNQPLSDPASQVRKPSQDQARQASQDDDRPSTADSIDDAVSEYLHSPRLSQRIPDARTGRMISFSDVGDPDGCVVFCCVGMGLTRYLTAFYDELALTLKLRLITPDRPGVGESEPYADGSGTPLGWPDDIRAICQHLKIQTFSVLAHSAGAIYALATALRMPQHIRGRIHLLAPWIPPSQMVSIGIHQDPLPVTTLPYSQRILRSLPTPFLKAANSSFFSVTSTSITTSLPKPPRRAKRKSLNQETFGPSGAVGTTPGKGPLSSRPPALASSPPDCHATRSPDMESGTLLSPGWTEKERQAEYDTRLTAAIWELATTNANPAVDLLVCLERRQDIGFRYVDITKEVVIHHGSRDSRVPVENVRWLAKTMRRCEVRVLEGEGHGLMAVATVMGGVLTEMAREWEDWIVLTRGRRGREA